MFVTKLLNSYGNPNPVGDKEIQGNWKDLDFLKFLPSMFFFFIKEN
jgi:hypothetical protein